MEQPSRRQKGMDEGTEHGDTKNTEQGDTKNTEQGESGKDAVGGTQGSSRRVRFSYADRGFGPTLVIGGHEPCGDADGVASGDETDEACGEHGLLTIGDAVVTLEIPRPDGSRAMLAWDPSEVAFNPLVA